MTDEFLHQITGGPLRPHEYVLVQPELTAADEQWIQNHLARVPSGGADGGRAAKDMLITLNLGDVQMATMKRAIRGWNLTLPRKQQDGSTIEVPLPFSTENIARLPSRIYRYLVAEYAKLHPDEEEEEEAFLPVVVDSSAESSDTMKLARKKR